MTFYKTYMNRLFLYTQNYLIQVTLPFYMTTHIYTRYQCFLTYIHFLDDQNKMTKLC